MITVYKVLAFSAVLTLPFAIVDILVTVHAFPSFFTDAVIMSRYIMTADGVNARTIFTFIRVESARRSLPSWRTLTVESVDQIMADSPVRTR